MSHVTKVVGNQEMQKYIGFAGLATSYQYD